MLQSVEKSEASGGGSAKPWVRKIREPEFAKRLALACDNDPNIPGLRYGRLTYIVDQMQKRTGETLRLESVRRWMNGEVLPVRKNMEALADILKVEASWLAYGIDPALDARERRARQFSGYGAINIVAGLIEMDGGTVAFPDPDDAKPETKAIDLYAIIRGANYSIHIATAVVDPKDEKQKFVIPTYVENSVVLGLLREGFSFTIYEIPSSVIEDAGTRKGGHIEIEIASVQADLRKIEDFRQRF